MENFWQKLTKPIIGLAPMDGVTDEPMRQIQCQIAKPDVIYTEYISVEGFTRKPEIFLKKLAFQENERPIVAQVFGYSPECFFEAVQKIASMGFDGIDINMGCPAKEVVSRGGGGSLIGNYQQAEEIVRKSLSAIKKSGRQLPLSVKTRIGKDQPITKEWISFLAQFPFGEITVHGRLLKQGLSGPVNWEEIALAATIAKSQKIIFLGNGGIKSFTEARRRIKRDGLDGILIGQAALGNPWIFKSSYFPDKSEVLGVIIDHGEKAYAFYGNKGYLSVIKHFGWYPRGFLKSKSLRVSLQKTRTLGEVRKVIEKFRENQ